MGRHNAPEIGPQPGADAEQTRELTPVPDSEDEPAGRPVRVLILCGVLAAVVLGAVGFAVSAATGSGGDGALVAGAGTPSLAWGSPVVISTTSAPVDSGSPSPAGSPSPVPSGSPSRSAAAVPVGSPSPPPSRTGRSASATPAAGLTAQFQQLNAWPDGYQGRYTITNRGTGTVTGWTVVVTFSGPGSISVWDASPKTGPNHMVTFTAQPYNATIAPGASVTFGFNVSGSPAPTPVGCTVNGRPCG